MKKPSGIGEAALAAGVAVCCTAVFAVAGSDEVDVSGTVAGVDVHETVRRADVNMPTPGVCVLVMDGAVLVLTECVVGPARRHGG